MYQEHPRSAGAQGAPLWSVWWVWEVRSDGRVEGELEWKGFSWGGEMVLDVVFLIVAEVFYDFCWIFCGSQSFHHGVSTIWLSTTGKSYRLVSTLFPSHKHSAMFAAQQPTQPETCRLQLCRTWRCPCCPSKKKALVLAGGAISYKYIWMKSESEWRSKYKRLTALMRSKVMVNPI